MNVLAAPASSVLAILALPLAALYALTPSTSDPLQQTSPPLESSTAANSNPDPEGLSNGTEEVRAAIVQGWGGGGASAWSELNEEWPLYGETSIFIDTVSLGEVVSFDYADLVASGADVIILSDVAGGLAQLSPSEIDALHAYAVDGHNIIGTYLTFRFPGIDNSALAPTFGLLELNFAETGSSISNNFGVIEHDPLFAGVPREWTSTGHAFTAGYLADPPFRPDIVAECDGYRAVITRFDAPTYSAFYFSNMPEHFGGPLDKQLLYNAIVD